MHSESRQSVRSSPFRPSARPPVIAEFESERSLFLTKMHDPLPIHSELFTRSDFAAKDELRRVVPSVFRYPQHVGAIRTRNEFFVHEGWRTFLVRGARHIGMDTWCP